MQNTIDLLGINCPMNFVQAKLALEKIGAGEVLEVLLDDGEPVRSVPRSLKDEHWLLGLKESNGHFVLSLEKAGD